MKEIQEKYQRNYILLIMAICIGYLEDICCLNVVFLNNKTGYLQLHIKTWYSMLTLLKIKHKDIHQTKTSLIIYHVMKDYVLLYG